MKKIMQLISLSMLMIGLSVSCVDPEPETLPAPTELKVGTVTQTTAALSWKAVEGAEKYNVSIGEGAPVKVTGTAYEASGLTLDTDYIWKVQAVKGETVSAWAEGAGFKTLAEDAVPVPTELVAVDVTDTSATLTWQHADADSHEVVVGNGEAVAVNGLTHPLTGLTPETAYIWKVRSSKDGKWSEWADGEGFSTAGETPAPTNLDVAYVKYNTASFTWQHADADTHELVIGDKAPVTVTDPAYQASDLTPETEYTWKVRSAKNNVWSQWAEGDEFTTTVAPTDFGTLTSMLGATYYNNGLGDGTVDLWMISASDPTFVYQYGAYSGDGWYFKTEISTALDSGQPLPDATYRIANSPAPGYARSGYTSSWGSQAGTWLIHCEDGVVVGEYALWSGTIISTHSTSDGFYTLEIEARTAEGLEFVGTVYGAPPIDFGYLDAVRKLVRTGDTWDILLSQSAVTYDGNGYTGTGWVFQTQVFTTPGNETIPNATYTIDDSSATGSARSGYESGGSYVGTWAFRVENGEITEAHPLGSGTVQITVTGSGTHSFTIRGKTVSGRSIAGTAQGKPPVAGAPVM